MKRKVLGEIQVQHAKLPAKAKANKATKAKTNFEKKKMEETPKPKKQVTPKPKKHEVPALEQYMEVVEDDDVPDILDIDDDEDPQMCGEYAPSIYAYLKEVENGLTIRKNFLHG